MIDRAPEKNDANTAFALVRFSCSRDERSENFGQDTSCFRALDQERRQMTWLTLEYSFHFRVFPSRTYAGGWISRWSG